jgi:transposase
MPAMRGRKTSLVVDLPASDRIVIEQWQRSTTIGAGLARRGLVLLLLTEGLSLTTIARQCRMTERQIRKWILRYLDHGLDGLKDRSGRGRKPLFAPCGDDKAANLEIVSEALFSLLHSPPSSHRINRTSWKMDDVQRVLQKQGIPVSLPTISQIIRNAGYGWRSQGDCAMMGSLGQ